MSDDADDTVIRPRTSGRSGSPDEDTVIRPRPPVPRSAPPGPGHGLPAPAGVPAPTASGGAPPVGPAPGLQTVRSSEERVASIRIGDRVVRLDHPVVIGRKPSTPRIVVGAAPELIAVRSGSGQVSSSHLSIRAEGTSVVVEDLRSTNGTVVRPAGAPSYRMPTGSSRVVLTGTLVEIGDGITIEILSPHLRATPDRQGADAPEPGFALPPIPGHRPIRERSRQ